MHDPALLVDIPGDPTSIPLGAAVALAALRPGSDTRALRMLAEMLAENSGSHPAGLLATMAARLWTDPAEAASRVTRARVRAASACRAAAAAGHWAITLFDRDYPPLLRQLPDPAVVLWGRGDPTSLSADAVALVGSRNATTLGMALAGRLASGLAEAGLMVISGLARGIDGAAHRGALEARGRTLAVLGSGVDLVYPAQHASLAEQIVQSGALVSEFPAGTLPLARHFPLRNRIISGLVRAVVVVEASEKSGSLITARMALEQGRDVLAVPGSVLSGCHRGCHALIKDGARLVETVEDILDELGWKHAAPARPARAPGDDLRVAMPRGIPFSLDQLAAKTRRTASDLLVELTEREVAGQVARMAGGLFVRLD